MFDLSATFLGADVYKAIDKIKANMREMKEGDKRFVAQISAPIYKDVIDHFKQEEGQDGQWTAWSDSYAEHMDRKGKGGNNILQYSGRLRNAFKPTMWRRGKDGLTWFNNAKTKSGFPYAFAHNEGGDTLPKRDFMWLSDQPLLLISQMAARYFMFGVKE